MRSDWGNYTFDLAEYFEERSGDRGKASYRRASYVAYEDDKDVMPAWTFITGHFVAYFRSGDDWYKADDSAVTLVGMGGAPPTDFPYICIFERVDLDISLPWPPMSFDKEEEDGQARDCEEYDAAPPAS